MNDSDRTSQLPDNPQQQSHSGLTVVGIGASAGGLAALKEFFARVPADSGLAYVVVVHLSPAHESFLAELLQPALKIPVQQITETTRLEANHAYVIPPNANLNTIDTHLRLSELEANRRERVPIDHFLRTLASTHDGDAVAVILTGTGSDGTLGVVEIKGKGGLTIAQDPLEAEYDGMPTSAIASGMVDLVLPVAQIPEAIIRYVRTQPRLGLPGDNEEPNESQRQLLRKVFSQIRSRTGRDFSRYKRSTVLRRISRRMQLARIEELPLYLQLLRDQGDESRALADELLITVTNFFRDPATFETLEKDVIPKLLEDKGSDASIRIWSVGCASGEEAYSLAMLFSEALARRDAPPTLQIFASDLHEHSLARARDGIYPADIEADVSAERLQRFFQRENGGYRVRKELRDSVVFAAHNLLADPPFSKLDLVACRNLLIYLQREVQSEVIELFHYALRPHGYLLLGSSETADAADLFRVEDKKHCVYQKLEASGTEPRLPVFPPSRALRLIPPSTPTADTYNRYTAHRQLHARMLDKHGPASLLVGPDDRITHLSQHAGRFLMHPGGDPTSNVLKLVRDELRIELRAALHQARNLNRPVRSNPVPLGSNGKTQQIVLDLKPATDEDQRGFVLVIFEEHDAVHPPAPRRQRTSKRQERELELETELTVMKQRLQALIEQYETTREEMKAFNEELQSANEELRSTMEELETSREELQSTNEELQTVNQENRNKVEELGQLSADLQCLLTATDIATLFLDRELRILRFTPKAAELFSIRAIDRNRPLTELSHRLGDAELPRDAERVLRHLAPIERELHDDAGRTFLTRVLPYRDATDRIVGVVVTFVDITAQKLTEQRLIDARVYAERIFDTLHEPLLVMTSDLRVIAANPAFFQNFRVRREDTIGHLIYALGNGQWDIPALRRLLDDVLPHDHVFNDYLVVHDFEGIGRRAMLLNARRLDHQQLILLGIRDITKTQRTEDALRDTEARYRALVHSAQEYAIVLLDPQGTITTWGGGAERIFGYTREEAVGQPGTMLFTREDREAGVPQTEMETAEREGRAADDRWHARKDGSLFWAAGAMEALRHPDGTLHGYSKMLRDNTARRATEEALRASELRFREMTDTVPDALFTTTADGVVDYVNRQHEDMTGARPAEVIGTRMWPQLIHPDDRARVQGEWDDACRQRYRFETRYRLRNPSGTYCWVIVRARPVFSEPGVLEQWIGTVTDIDALTRAEEEVRELNRTLEVRVDERTRELHSQQQRLARLIEASSGIVWTTDPHGKLVEDSPSWREFTGQTYEQLKDEGWANVVHPDDRALAISNWARAVKFELPLDAEYRIRHAASDSWRWANVRAFPLRGDNGEISGWIGMTLDIDARKRSEMQVRELATRLTAAEQHERHRIAQILHDELQQQLYSARIQAVQLIRRAQEKADEQIAAEAQRLYDELGETINSTRQLSIDLWPPSLGEGLGESLKWLASQMEESYQLNVEVAIDGLPEIRNDSFRVLLFRIARELLFNVVKHADADAARLSLGHDDGALVLSVSDDGAGFEPDERGRAGKSSFGLYGIRDRLRLFDGEMTIESRPTGGTTVVVRVPLANVGGGPTDGAE